MAEREELIRHHFEAYRDYMWARDLAPALKDRDADEVEWMRSAWNERIEERDWTWWQKGAAGLSTAELEEQLPDMAERLDTLGMLLWRDERGGFRKLIAEAGARAANDREGEIER